MDEIEPQPRASGVSTILVAVVLAVLAGGLVAQIAIATSAAAKMTDSPARRSMIHLAWLALTMLALNALISFWLLIRVLFARSRRLHVGGPTPYIDAWSTAGKRFQLDDGEEAEGNGEEDDGEGDKDARAT